MTVVAFSRFSVRWVKLNRFRNTLPRGCAVFDGARRITIPFATRGEAEQHCARIAEIYARYGW